MSIAPTGDFVFSPKVRQRSIVRKQISRYSSPTIGLNIKGIVNKTGEFVDPDVNSVQLQLYLETEPGQDDPPGDLIATITLLNGLMHPDVGQFTYVLQPNQTPDSSLMTAVWTYNVGGAQFK